MEIRTVEEAKAWRREQDNAVAQIRAQIETAQERLRAITDNALYRLLPSWVRNKIEDIFGGNDE